MKIRKLVENIKVTMSLRNIAVKSFKVLFLLVVLISCVEKRSDSNYKLKDYQQPSVLEGIVIESSIDKKNNALISKLKAFEDLDELSNRIESIHSYIYCVDFDYEKAIKTIKKNISDSISVSVLAIQIHKLIQNIGDSHAQVDQWMSLLPKRFSPAKYGIKNNRIFAYKPDASGLLDKDRPYVRAIDGIDIKDWFLRAADIGSGRKSSESSRFIRGRRTMEYLDFMRSELGLQQKDSVTFQLESLDKNSIRSITLSVQNTNRPEKPFGLNNESKLLKNNIGYLRIYTQRGDILKKSIEKKMVTFKNTDALIVDARQCGGGSRSNLQTLFPYFMSQSDSAYIANVAKLRIPEDVKNFDPKGKLDVGDKKLKYIENATAEQKVALKNFLRTFKPSCELPKNKFTDWYFMAMTPQSNKYFYNKPIYVLVDFGVGSAGDIFASTLKNWRNISLVGTPTNGRSGNSFIKPLKNSNIPVRLSTMVSYQKTGELYDWVGIQPDIFMEPEISDWLETTDTVLDRLIKKVAEDL